MPKALRLLSFAALLATGTSLAMAAGPEGGHSVGQETTTGRMTGSQQVPTPATGTATSPTGMSAQTTGPAYPGVVGPTGSTQPDATNPVRSSPSSGGQDNGGGASSGAGGTSGASR